jgi:hypothetical protein
MEYGRRIAYASEIPATRLRQKEIQCRGPRLLPMKLEIGHVLFIDIVGYSKLLIAEHSDQIQELKESYAKENSFA